MSFRRDTGSANIKFGVWIFDSHIVSTFFPHASTSAGRFSHCNSFPLDFFAHADRSAHQHPGITSRPHHCTISRKRRSSFGKPWRKLDYATRKHTCTHDRQHVSILCPALARVFLGFSHGFGYKLIGNSSIASARFCLFCLVQRTASVKLECFLVIVTRYPQRNASKRPSPLSIDLALMCHALPTSTMTRLQSTM